MGEVPVSERDAVRSQVIDALEAQKTKETGMKKISTTTAKKFEQMLRMEGVATAATGQKENLVQSKRGKN
jgi:hypothetical protein